MKKATLIVMGLAMLTASVNADDRRVCLYAPRQQYPAGVSRKIVGSGVFEIGVAADGHVFGYKIVRSTGNATLDNAALAALRQWRFRAAAKASRVTVPMDFNG